MQFAIPKCLNFLSIEIKLSTAVLVMGLTGAFTPVQADDYDDVRQMVRAGKSAEAMRKADQFLATRPHDPQMQFLKGVLLRDAQKTGEAIATFTRLTQDYPELPEPYNNLAALYAGQNQFEKAREALEMAIRNNASYAMAHENLADIYVKLAAMAYEKTLQLEPGNASARGKLAQTRELLNPTLQSAKPAITPKE